MVACSHTTWKSGLSLNLRDLGFRAGRFWCNATPED